MPQCDVHRIQKRMRLKIVFHKLRRESSEVDVQVSLDVVYLKDTSWGKYDKVVGLYRYLVEIDRGFHFSGSTKYENLAFQAHRIVSVQP